jgi:hypothetical protein
VRFWFAAPAVSLKAKAASLLSVWAAPALEIEPFLKVNPSTSAPFTPAC